MAVELEGLSYEIEAQTGDSAKQLDTLASSLEKLKAASGGLKLGSTSNQLKKLSEAVSGIETKSVLKLRQMSKALGELASAGDIRISKSIGSGITNVAKSADSITDERIDRITRLAEALKKLGDAGPVKLPSMKNLDLGTDSVKASAGSQPVAQVVQDQSAKQPTIVADIQKPDGLDAFQRGMLETAAKMSPLEGLALKTKHGIDALGGALAKAAPHVMAFNRDITIGFAKLPLMFGGRVLNGVRGMVSSLGGVFSGLMRIAKFRAYRTVIKLFTQGLKEGLDNLYYYSQLAGTSFAGALDSIATSANYVKNSLGAMASPLIEAVAPAIDFIADKIVALFNLINQLFSRLTGKSTYTAAKKISTTYKGAADSAGKSASGAAKKAKDELKKTILAFDEINKLNEPNKSSGGSGGGGGGAGGGGGGYGDMFEERPIDQAISDFADQLKAAINSGDWEGAGRLFGQKINEVFDLGEDATAKWKGWGTTLAGYINNAIDFAYGLLDETNFENIGGRISEFLSGLFDPKEGINFSKLGATIALAFTDAIDFAIGFIKKFPAEQVGMAINSFMTGFYDKFTEWVNDSDKDWEKLGETLEQKIVDFVFGLDPGSIEKSFRRAMSGAVTAITNIIKGMFVGMGKDLKGSIDENGLLEVGTTILNKIRDGVMDSNPIQWVLTYIIDPMIGALVGEKNWEDAKKTASTVIKKIGDGFISFFTDPVRFVKQYIIDPIVGALKDKANWTFQLPDIFGGLFGGGDKSGVEVPLTPKVENKSSTWLSDVMNYWSIPFGGGKNAQKFTAQPDGNNKKSWVSDITGWWDGLLGKGKNPQKFTAEPDQKSSKSWVKGISGWWNDHFGGKKNTQKFNAEGEATKLHDKIPAAQKKFDSIAQFKDRRDNLTGDMKTFSSTANFLRRNNLSAELRTFDSTANFTRRNNLSEANRTFASIANFNSRQNNLSNAEKTFATIANFNSRENNLSDAEKKFSTLANFNSREDSLSNKERKLDTEAYFIDASQKKTFSIDVIGNIIRTSGGSRGYTASGGVFTSKGKVPIQRYASGGLASGSQLFWAREAGPELVGTLGSHTAVMNNDQIVASVSAGVARAIAGIHFQLKGMQMPQPAPINEYLSAPEASHNDNNGELVSEARQQNALLRRQNDLLQRLLDKDTTVEVTTKQFASAANRQNRREGRTTIAVSAT